MRGLGKPQIEEIEKSEAKIRKALENEGRPLSFNELKKRAGLSGSTLSVHLRDMINKKQLRIEGLIQPNQWSVYEAWVNWIRQRYGPEISRTPVNLVKERNHIYERYEKEFNQLKVEYEEAIHRANDERERERLGLEMVKKQIDATWKFIERIDASMHKAKGRYARYAWKKYLKSHLILPHKKLPHKKLYKLVDSRACRPSTTPLDSARRCF